MNNKDKIILDLCGGTGAWSLPYRKAGYDVRVITLPDYDVIQWEHYYLITEPIKRQNVYGILAAPPCTMFSFARTNAKKPRDLIGAMEIVRACMTIIHLSQMKLVSNTAKYTNLKFWALENPYFGLLKNFIGKPAFIFDPWEFGDGYQKRTALWGNFNEPIKNPVPMSAKAKAKAKTNSYLHTRGTKFDMLKNKDIHSEAFGVFDSQARRSITPAGFARAFFEANQ